MSLDGLHVSAHLTGHHFTPGERIGWKLVVVAREAVVVVPDPLSDTAALTLKLRGPDGKTEVVRLGDIPPPGGVLPMPESRRLPPRGKVVFEADLAEHFPHIGFGRHWLQLEYKVDEHVWRSPEMPFDFISGHALFLDVTPNDATGPWSTLLWVERGPTGGRAMLFEDDKNVTSVQGATQLAAVPDGAEPVLGSRPANKQHTDRWVAWIAGAPSARSLHVEYYAGGDPEQPADTLHPPPVKLPADLHEPRIVRPLLDQWADEGRPPSTIPILARNADGSEALHIMELDAKGRVAPGYVVPIAGVAAGCWGLSPSLEARLFAWAIQRAGEVVVSGVEIPWHRHGHGHAAGQPTPRAWLAIEAEAFLAGDLRCTFEGLVWMGALVRRGSAWERLVFVAPAGGRAQAEAEIVHRATFTPPDGAELVRARVDDAGRLHLLYRRGPELAYVPPNEQKATFTDGRLGLHAPATAHLVLGFDGRRVIVGYDPERGPVWKVL